MVLLGGSGGYGAEVVLAVKLIDNELTYHSFQHVFYGNNAHVFFKTIHHYKQVLLGFYEGLQRLVQGEVLVHVRHFAAHNVTYRA